jgi:hypothetical protein
MKEGARGPSLRFHRVSEDVGVRDLESILGGISSQGPRGQYNVHPPGLASMLGLQADDVRIKTWGGLAGANPLAHPSPDISECTPAVLPSITGVFSLLPSLLIFLHYIIPQKNSFYVHSTSELESITSHSVSGFSESCLAGVYYAHLAKREVSGPESHSWRMAEDSFEPEKRKGCVFKT